MLLKPSRSQVLDVLRADFLRQQGEKIKAEAAAPEMPQYEINNLTIEGDTEEGSMTPDGKLPPFALFSPDLQRNVGGPYAERQHAVAALELMRTGKMVPYCDCPGRWCINGELSPWYK